jgi:hypothetical protein
MTHQTRRIVSKHETDFPHKRQRINAGIDDCFLRSGSSCLHLTLASERAIAGLMARGDPFCVTDRAGIDAATPRDLPRCPETAPLGAYPVGPHN